MKKIIFILLMVPTILHISFSNIDAQSAGKGKITGVVKDKNTGEPLGFTGVGFTETNQGVVTDLEGEFVFNNLSPGTYTLKASYIGYNSQTIKATVTEGKVTKVTFELIATDIMGETVVITAQAEGQLAAINQQLNSNSIVNVVSKARIKELPDVNAAEAVGRLPGTSIIRDGGEGTKVVIRGLQPKLNVITVNGMRLPSTSANDRSVDLSMISTDILDGIELSKALTPNKDADAIGGTIDFKLKRAPSGLRTSILAQKGYNGLVKNFTPMKFNVNASDRFFDNEIGVMGQVLFERADRSADNFGGSYGIQREKREDEIYAPNEINNIRLTDRSETRDRYGASLLLDYEFADGKIILNTLFNRMTRESSYHEFALNANANTLMYRPYMVKSITDMLMSSISVDYRFLGITAEGNVSFSRSLRRTPYNRSIDLYESSAFKSPVVDQGPEIVPSYAKFDIKNTIAQYLTQISSTGDEKNYTADLNFTAPVQITVDLRSELKFGGKFQKKSRMFDEFQLRSRTDMGTEQSRFFRLFPDAVRDYTRLIPLEFFLTKDYSPYSFLNNKYSIPYTVDFDLEKRVFDEFGNDMWFRRDGDADDYSNRESVGAAYAMEELKLGTTLMFLAGVRFEYDETYFQAFINDIQVTSTGDEQGSIKEVSSKRYHRNWFPMFHLRYKPFDWMDIRLAKTKSLSRPDFNMISPKYTINDPNKVVVRGSPGLNPAIAENYDFQISAYESQYGLLSVSAFYKEITGFFYNYSRVAVDPAVENLETRMKGYTLTDYINSSNKTYVRGIEIDFQTQLRFLPGMFSGIVLNVNYTKVGSNTEYPNAVVEVIRVPGKPPVSVVRYIGRSERMLFQPNDVLNLAVGYDYKGFSGRVSLLFQGNTLTNVGNRPETAGFTSDLVRWDITLKQDLWERTQIFLNFNNVTNRPDRSVEAVHSYDTSVQYFGFTSDLGIKYSF